MSVFQPPKQPQSKLLTVINTHLSQHIYSGKQTKRYDEECQYCEPNRDPNKHWGLRFFHTGYHGEGYLSDEDVKRRAIKYDTMLSFSRFLCVLVSDLQGTDFTFFAVVRLGLEMNSVPQEDTL